MLGLITPKVFTNFNYETMVNGIRFELSKPETLLIIGGEGEPSSEVFMLDLPREQQINTAALVAEHEHEHENETDDVIKTLYTSRTTGEPKGVVHNSNTLISNASLYADRLHLTSDDRFLMASPVALQKEFLCGVIMMSVYLDITAALQTLFDADYFCEVIAVDKPAFNTAATWSLTDLVRTAPKYEDELNALIIFVCVGALISSVVADQASRILKAKIVSACDNTENGAVVRNYLMKRRLSKSYQPEYLEVIEAMSRANSSKIQKFKLRELAKHTQSI